MQGKRLRSAGWALSAGLAFAFFPPDVCAYSTSTTSDHFYSTKTARQVRQMSAQEAQGHMPVRLRGVVTYFDPHRSVQHFKPDLYLQDRTSGIFVALGEMEPKSIPDLRAGDLLEVKGHTEPGDFARIVTAESVSVLGRAAMPAAESVNMDQVIPGEADAQWVELRGVIRAVIADPNGLRVKIADKSKTVFMRIPSATEKDIAVVESLLDATVRVRGVCANIFNRKGQRLGVELYLPDLRSISISEPPPGDAFQSVIRPMNTLLTFTPDQNYLHRVHVRGVVTLQRVSHSLYVKDSSGSLFIQMPVTREVFYPGDLVDAVGFVESDGRNANLHDAVIRKVGAAELVQPRMISASDDLDDRFNDELVQLDGKIVSSTRNQLVVGSGKYTFTADLDSITAKGPLLAYPENTTVRLVGVYWVRYGENGKPLFYRLVLRSPQDVTVLHRAPWWTSQRVVMALFAISWITAMSLVWIWLLRKQVRQQTDSIRKQSEQEAHLHEQLRQAQKMEAVGRLAGGIAHDFNNLLTVIKGYSELVIENVAHDPGLRAEVEEIKRAAERAASLTSQLLAFSRQQMLAPKIINLNELILDLEKMLVRLLGESVRMETSLDPHLGRVKADPGQIEQVIMNLVVNARDAMLHGGTVTISTKNARLKKELIAEPETIKPGDYVVVLVSDSGTGIDEPTRARIFEPFFTTKEPGKGTGLGLSTVYGIVTQSGGHISVESPPGSGAIFKVYLPCVDSPEEFQALTPTENVLHGNETILVVEDEDAVCALVEHILSKSGYSVLTASSGDEAIAICQQRTERIDLLLTDVVLTNISGRDLTEKIVALRPEIKTLFMSGYTDDAILHHGVLESSTAFLQKPFTMQTLVAKVREVLDSSLVRT